MSITLTAEQFSALLEKSSVKKITKTQLEKRNNAMDINEFMKNFKYSSVTKLLTLELPDFMVYSILENLSNIEDDEMPFVCSNYQTKSFYYKENGEWKKGHDFIKKIYNGIFNTALKQITEKYTKQYDHSDDDDDDKIERKYETSLDNEKQKIIRNLCNCDKYPYSKCADKILSKLGKMLKDSD